jgi:hypothetical protein
LRLTKAGVQLFRHNLNAWLKEHIDVGAWHIFDL